LETVKKAIHEAANRVIGTTLDRSVHVDLDSELKILCEPLFSIQELDISVDSVVSVKLNAITSEGEGGAWREMALKLHCRDWGSDVFDYWDNPIGDSEFSPINSHDDLRFSAYGGAIHCDNGVHRLIGGMVYLVDKNGGKAHFKAVNVEYYIMLEDVRKVLDEYISKYNRFPNVSVSKLPYERSCKAQDGRSVRTTKLFKVGSGLFKTTYLISEKGAIEKPNWLYNLFALKFVRSKNIPIDILKRMYQENWLHQL